MGGRLPDAWSGLTDYVTLKTARAIVAGLGVGVLPARRYDDKFGILWAPSTVPELLEACRVESWLLRTTMGVAFVDIDDFKQVNALLTETVVDRRVLPRLTNAPVGGAHLPAWLRSSPGR